METAYIGLNMSLVMAEDKASDRTEENMTIGTDESGSKVTQKLEEVQCRLECLSEKINLCNIVLNDLKDLSKALERSHQDASAPET